MVHHVDRWDYLAQHPNEAAVFDAAMSANTALESAQVASGFDFSRFRIVADLGGGAGGLLATILSANPAMRWILFDRPHVVAGAHAVLTAAGVADRCDVVAGHLFKSAPEGADAYLLKSVIHDWADPLAVEILKTCRSVMTETAKLLLVEHVIRPGNAPDPARFIDLLMLVMNGGRERTIEEFEALLGAAGFCLSDVTPTSQSFSVIEADPV